MSEPGCSPSYLGEPLIRKWLSLMPDQLGEAKKAEAKHTQQAIGQTKKT